MSGLQQYERQEYSQFGEDGIIAEIISRLSLPAPGVCIEIGAGDGSPGLPLNTEKLLHEGWRCLWIDGDARSCFLLRRKFKIYTKDNRLTVLNTFLTAENINESVDGFQSATVVSIDIDGNDYYIWQALAMKPDVVCIEYDARLGVNDNVVVPYDPQYRWDVSDYVDRKDYLNEKSCWAIGRTSLKAMECLGRQLGYSLVHVGSEGINAFFVRDCHASNFTGPFTSEFLGEPARCLDGLRRYGWHK